MVAESKVTADDIKVSDKAFEFLVVQKGKLEPLRADRQAWEAEYRAGLQRNYDAIKMHLPAREGVQSMMQFLDIGSGLGGIDILISRHYGNQAVPVLLDGVKDKPVMTLHRQTFNDMRVAETFLTDNGVGHMAYIDPAMKPLHPMSNPAFLVVSFGAWCFHVAPEVYLEYALANSIKGATFILDVRKDKPAWKAKLETALTLKAIVHGANKFDRCVYVAN